MRVDRGPLYDGQPVDVIAYELATTESGWITLTHDDVESDVVR